MSIVHISSTTKGGGVAEILRRMVRYPEMEWIIPYEEIQIPEQDITFFYKTTKKFHNMLQGDQLELKKENIEIYEKVNNFIWNYVKKELHKKDPSVVIVHDPQPAYLIPLIKKEFPNIPIIWRCHIDLSDPNPAVWEYLAQFINISDVSIFHTEEFVPRNLIPTAIIMPPSIDPKSFKNRSLGKVPATMLKRILNLYIGEQFDKFVESLKMHHVRTNELEYAGQQAKSIDLEQAGHLVKLVKILHGIGRHEPYIVQVSRYDKFKDPIGVVEAYVRFIKRASNLENLPSLIYVGELVDDDPEGMQVYRELVRTITFLANETPGIANKIKLLIMPNWDKEANAVEVNVLQREAMIVMQKSVAEGFGLTATEAMWKEKVVIGGNVGGLKRQIMDDFSGYLVNSIYDAAEYIDRLYFDPKLADGMGVIGKQIVERRYILPVHVENYKMIFAILQDKELKKWLSSKKMVEIQGIVSKVKRASFLRRKSQSIFS